MNASDEDFRLADFKQSVSGDAADVAQKLQERHKLCSFTSHPTQPITVAWEETWSSTEVNTRDPNGEVLVHKLGQILRNTAQTFQDPFFPADVSSLFVDPTQAEKNKAAASTARLDEDAFLAGKDVQNDISWQRVKDIGNPNDKPVVFHLIDFIPLSSSFARRRLKYCCILQVFSGSVSPEDVQQGQLGNCCESTSD